MAIVGAGSCGERGASSVSQATVESVSHETLDGENVAVSMAERCDRRERDGEQGEG